MHALIFLGIALPRPILPTVAACPAQDAPPENQTENPKTSMAEFVTLPEIHAARERIRGTAVYTPLVRLDPARVSAAGYHLGPHTPEIFLKNEAAQPIGSFKLRGAFNKVAALRESDPAAFARGVITFSSGNHAQGVAYAARALGTRAVIVMPGNAPTIKRQATEALGAEIVTVGPASTERRQKAEELVAAHGYAMIPPYDDPDIIAGQATCGLELAEQLGLSAATPEASALAPEQNLAATLVLSPVSGGGLLSGTAAGLKLACEAGGQPPPAVWGVEPELAGDAHQSFATKTLVEWPAEHTTRTVADGLRTQSLGVRNFDHILRYVDGILTVSETEILAATRLVLAATDLTVEPSGAVSLAAALFHGPELPPARRVIAIVSGGNIDPATGSNPAGRHLGQPHHGLDAHGACASPRPASSNTCMPLLRPVLTLFACALLPGLAPAQKRLPERPAADNASRATILHNANVYAVADPADPPITTVMPGRELVINQRNGAWVNVFANTDTKEEDPDQQPEFTDTNTQSNPASGWIRDKGIVGPRTPGGDALLYGAAADLEAKAAESHAPKGAAESAGLLYRRVWEYFPNSPLAPEAAFRSADIRWQVEKADNSTLPSAHEQDAFLRPQLYEGELKRVMKTYPDSPDAAKAAYDLLDNKLCGDWQGLPKCPEMETNLYVKYADRYPNGPRSPEALYNAVLRQGSLVTMYLVDDNRKHSEQAAASTQALAARMQKDFPTNDYTQRAASIAFRVSQGISIYGSDRD